MLNGSPIMWKSKRQNLVTRSTCEAELLAMYTDQAALSDMESQSHVHALAACLNYGIGCRNILESAYIKSESPFLISCDNQAALKVAKEGSNWTNRHYLNKATHLRDLYQKGIVDLEWVQSSKQKADVLTKFLPKQAHLNACKDLNLRRLSSTLR